MHSNQTDVIRYVMDEMDPSERLTFEKKLQSDENLLIEVESFKNTWKRTHSVPKVSAPKIVQEQILSQALTHADAKSNTTLISIISTHKYKIAAGFVLIVTALFSWGPKGVLEQTSSLVSNSNDTERQLESSFTNSKDRLELGFENNGQNNVQDKSLKPWIDNNQVIRFAGTTDLELTAQPSLNLSSEYSNKLRLVNDKTGYSSQSRKILLTGNTP